MSQVYFDGDAREVSRYFARFQRLFGEPRGEAAESYGGLITLKGDMLLVEKLPKVEMKTKTGIIIADHKSYKETSYDSAAEFGLVLATGPGQQFEDGSILPCDAKPGDVILLPGSVAWYSQFGHMADYEPYTIGRLRDGQVAISFTDYKKAFDILNSKE